MRCNSERTKATMAFAMTMAFALLVVGRVAGAHDHATGIVKERMEAMERMGKAMKAISQRIQSKRDLESIKQNAQLIQSLAVNIPALFPKGSMQHPTEARLQIWERWSDFECKAQRLQSESNQLATTDISDLSVLTAQVAEVSKICSGCHEAYRLKK